MKTLRLILGDQLNSSHSWFRKDDSNITYVMMELRSETDYAVHHIQKVAGFFKAMRCFAEELKQQGHQVLYLKIHEPHNKQSFSENIKQLIQKHQFKKWEYQLPDEYRLDTELKQLAQSLHIEVQVYDTEHFFTTRNTLRDMFPSGTNYLMETFYRNMRRNHNILMQEGKPLGGFWNYDKENRKKLPRNMVLPEPYAPANDVSDILNELSLAGVKAIGYIRGNHFQWPVSRQQALDALEHFCTHCLPHFGTYQDAMTMKSETVFHSLLSFALNIKLLSPHEVIGRVIREANQRSQEISLSQTEGFVRQILGWREFMRGVYWARMPAYSGLNYFQHHRKLPQWYWTGNTKMNCLKHAIQQSLQHAYAHHIQRLMLTGNFALLSGINPDEVDAWYLGIYIDAIEWVEITNTRGMSQFADGGLLATKPYVSSANYIEKMSDYCSTCYYKAKQKTGECACPFNSLYWHFFKRHRNLLQHNPRIAMMYKVWDAMPHDSQDAYMAQAEHYLQNIEYL